MQRKKAGTVCMLLGALLMLAALTLFLWNQREAWQAGKAAERILPQLVQKIEAHKAASEAKAPFPPDYGDPGFYDLPRLEDGSDSYEFPNWDDSPKLLDPAMTAIEIDSLEYVGYLSLPALELSLPVLSEWDDTRLHMAPCRYSGSTKTNNLVIAAHNYRQHFGLLAKLSAGDPVLFTGTDGEVWHYEVAVIEILSPASVQEMISGEYDLTLFTCTYDGQNRVTVRCEKIQSR